MTAATITMAGPVAVSYTHLDVYKRQVQIRVNVVRSARILLFFFIFIPP